MGLESICKVRLQKRQGEGKVRLESKHLSFSGDFRFKIPLTEIRDYRVRRGGLELETEEGLVRLELGSQRAERWYLKLRYPRSLIDKLGVKEDQIVSVIGLEASDSEEFWRFLESRTDRISKSAARQDSDFIFFKVESVEELERLAEFESFLKRNGSIWALWPKGQTHLKQGHVMAAAKEAGLVDVKVVSFSDRLSALKLMIPVSRR